MRKHKKLSKSEVKEADNCVNCGKRMRLSFQSGPMEYPSATYGALCEECHSFLCHTCRWSLGFDKCPKCGSSLSTICDEYLGK